MQFPASRGTPLTIKGFPLFDFAGLDTVLALLEHNDVLVGRRILRFLYDAHLLVFFLQNTILENDIGRQRVAAAAVSRHAAADHTCDQQSPQRWKRAVKRHVSEAPQVCKAIGAIIGAQCDLVEPLARLRRIAVLKG